MDGPKPELSDSPEQLDEYRALRSEIHQSIHEQYQLLVGGYGLTCTIVGYAMSRAPQPAWEVFAVVPFILIAMTALWAVEANRMVRASFYIGHHLWPTITGGKTGWELWIRDPKDKCSINFRRRQDWLQLLVTLFLPIGASITSLIIITTHVSHWAALLLWLAAGVLWLSVGGFTIGVSNLAAISIRRP